MPVGDCLSIYIYIYTHSEFQKNLYTLKIIVNVVFN